MRRAGFYKTDWFIALLVGLAFMAAVGSSLPLLQKLEFLAYDTGVKLTPRTPDAAENIAIIAIDNSSIAQTGRWPWPRSVFADMIERLSHAKAVALLVLLSEPQTDAGLDYIRRIRERFASREAGELRAFLDQAEKELDTDAALTRAIQKNRRLHLPMFFQVGKPAGRPESALPEFVQRHRFSRIVARPDTPAAPVRAEGAVYPLAALGARAAGIGHLNFTTDSDGGVRAAALAVEYDGEFYPSLPLLLAARSLNLRNGDLVLELGNGVHLGRLFIPTDGAMRMYSGFHSARGNGAPFAIHSFHDVQSENVPAELFRDKIVLIGPTAPGLGDTYATPVATGMSAPELVANIVASLLNRDFYVRPPWAPWVEAGLFVAIVLYLMFALPNMGVRIAAALSLILIAVLIAIGQYLMVSEKIWLKSVSPALLLIVGHVTLVAKRLLQTGRDETTTQANRLLGLALQGRGQLDMAMDRFRNLPIDESVLELIYNLALEFERQRQFTKAIEAYDYILEHNPAFHDVGERRKRARQAESTLVLGARGANAGGTLILDGNEKPVLGRYEVIKELSKGAMGTVYLGRDPKLNRLVAIKTLALSREFEGPELEKAKERFFREAKTAGRLNHPNIVTVYDVDEEHDLAYIAMEYLPGKNLTHYITRGEPLPLPWVLTVGVRVADALTYAHRHDVVHRDIKPANIMYHEPDDTLKITDFGIARLTDTTRTRTGIILGTPSYMSPEQLTGKRVDGRSDLFSLGVTLFELATGRQPFAGDSLATLMYQIANERHPDVTRLRPDSPPCLAKALNRALQKDPDRRYASGEEMKRDLEQCLKRVADKSEPQGRGETRGTKRA